MRWDCPGPSEASVRDVGECGQAYSLQAPYGVGLTRALDGAGRTATFTRPTRARTQGQRPNVHPRALSYNRQGKLWYRQLQ